MRQLHGIKKIYNLRVSHMDSTDMERPTVLPFVTTIIVVRNEEKSVIKCFKSLINQDYPYDRYEIVVVDGESEDNTLQAIKDEIELRIADNAEVPEVRIIYNPKHILASGWNMGIRAGKGEYVVRIDAHAFVENDFIRRNVEVISRIKDASCVGGSVTTLSETSTGMIIKEALTSPFGVGGSRFRWSKKAGYVDTVGCGLYRRDVFEKIGFFNEKLIRTQDNDLHRRMRDRGMKFYLDPDIHVYYYSRDTYHKLAKQQFSNGKWTMINFLLRPGKMSVRHFIPLAFVLSVAITLLIEMLAHLGFVFTVLEILFYLISGFAFATRQTGKASHKLILPFVFLLIHFSYGTGSIAGLLALPGIRRS